jgi:uncharacterized protein (DUF2237 family)
MKDINHKTRNVLRKPLKQCSQEPRTGYRRDGTCNTGPQDVGRHVLCARVTREFLEFSRSRGNDLVTPRPDFDFPGLKPGDHWCLCIDRWLQALEAGVAPPVILEATHEAALQNVDLEILQRYASDAGIGEEIPEP